MNFCFQPHSEKMNVPNAPATFIKAYLTGLFDTKG